MTLEEAKKIVFEKKPILAEMYKKYRNKSWLEYAKENFKGANILNENKQELFESLEKILIPLIGKEKTERAVATIEKTGFVSTADHHGILCHPFFANSALVRSHPSLLSKENSIISLTCGGISLSNSSFPRGIFFHDNNLHEQRMCFASLRGRRRSVYGLPAISKQVFKRELNKLSTQNLPDDAKNNLKKILHTIIEKESVWTEERYSSQLTIINDILWEMLFGNKRGNLVYLEIESLVRDLLLSVHLEKDTDIHKLIFKKEWRDSYIKNFENVVGAHNTSDKKGSHIFWYIDEIKNQRKQLWIVGDNLVSENNEISMPLKPEIIREYLLRFELLPSMAFCYSILGFYYGLTLGGGFSQVQYLGDIKKAWKKVINENNSEIISNMHTDIFTGEFVLLGVNNKKDIQPASLIDTLIWHTSSTNDDINKTIETTNMGESLDLMMPEFIEIITGNKEQISNLPNIPKTFMIEKKQQIKCVYCGNNPTNHFFSHLSQTILVFLSPIVRLMAIMHHRYMDKIAKIILTPYLWLFLKLHLWSTNSDPKKARTERSEVIWNEAIARGIQMEQLVIFNKPVEQYRAKIDGHWRYFESIPIPEKFKASSYAWMDDKWELKKFLRKHNIPVAFGGSVSNRKQALETFRQGRHPFIAKPRLGSRGRHTSTFLSNEVEFLKGFDVAKALCHFAVVEEQLFGSVYRGTYINGEVVGILRGDPPRITGNGTQTIRELIEIKNQNKNPKVKDVLITPMLVEFIRRQDFTLETVLEKNKTIDLSEKIGLSYGGFAVEELPRTHTKILEYIKRAGDALDAPVIGFDFIIEDITIDPDQQRWGIIEANSLPFINLHHFPAEGTPINVAAKVWDLWEK